MSVISLNQAKLIRSKLHTNTIPGKNLCSVCRKKATKLIESGPSEFNYSSVEKDFPDVAEKETDREKFNENLTSVGVSPLKLHPVPAHSKLLAGKWKLKLHFKKRLLQLWI